MPFQEDGPKDPLTDNPPVVGESSGDSKRYIGVPDDYTIPQQYTHPSTASGGDVKFGRQFSDYTSTYDVRPIYFEGEEFRPANLPSNRIWEIQQALAKVGLLTGTFTRHTWDSPTRNAYKQLLALSNAQGLTWDRTLVELLATAGSKETGGGRYTVDENGNVVLAGTGETIPPLITKQTDPAILRSTFRRAVIEMLGEGWSSDEINKMVAAYNKVEVDKQTEAYNLELSGNPGALTDMPSPEQFVEQQVLSKDPVGVQTNEALGFTQEFMDLASAPAWGVG